MQDAEVLDAFGSLLAEHGPHDEAVRVLQQAVVVSPDDGHEKYMCAYITPQYSYPPACTPMGSRCCELPACIQGHMLRRNWRRCIVWWPNLAQPPTCLACTAQVPRAAAGGAR